MKISTKGRYGLRLMVELALAYQQQPVSLKEIAQSQSISVKYLEQIVSLLAKNGLVSSVRGAQGGYFLSKPPQDISVKAILDAVKEDMLPLECLESGCERQSCCMANKVWKQMRDAVVTTAEQLSLADIIQS